MSLSKEITVKPGQLENSICRNKDCKNPFFIKVYVLKKIPKIISGASKNIIQPIELYICKKCGELNPEMTPDGVLSKDN
ncbi:MAG: hypothetical protein IH845_04780 [Nanoarchaeota archaeon]|nr:hypothetical protein [Nanoarchaeota archaeon]